MRTSYFPGRTQRTWGWAVRAYLATTANREIRSLTEERRALLGRALNAFPQVPEGADTRSARSIERSRTLIRDQEMKGDDALLPGWFERAEPFVAEVTVVFTALHAWYVKTKEYLGNIESTLSNEDLAGLPRILPALIQPSELTRGLDVEGIRETILKELRRDGFDVPHWVEMAKAHLAGVAAVQVNVQPPEMPTIPKLDPLPGADTPEITTGGEASIEGEALEEDAPPVASPGESSKTVVTHEVNDVTGQVRDLYRIEVD